MYERDIEASPRSPGRPVGSSGHGDVIAGVENALDRHVGSHMGRHALEEDLRSVVAPERAAPGETRGVSDLDLLGEIAEEDGVVSGLECLVEALDDDLVAGWHGSATACTRDAAQSLATTR